MLTFDLLASKVKFASLFVWAIYIYIESIEVTCRSTVVKMGHTNHRNTGILPKYRNTREKYRYTCERHLLKTPVLALINQSSNIMSI